MKTRLPSLRYRAGFALLLGALLAGCSLLPKPTKDPTRYYVLTGPTPTEINAAPVRGPLKIGVRSVTVAPYLDGKAMIVRRGDNEIDYCDYARWAEPLATSISRMLVARLQLSAKVDRVFLQPYPFEITRDVDVTVTVLRCEGRVRPDGDAVASFLCGIEVVRVAGKEDAGAEVILRQVFEATETPWKKGDYAALAKQLSDTVTQLSDAIITALPAAAR